MSQVSTRCPFLLSLQNLTYGLMCGPRLCRWLQIVKKSRKVKVYSGRLVKKQLLRVTVRENQAKCEKAERWGSAKLFHTNIIDRLGGLMDKYT